MNPTTVNSFLVLNAYVCPKGLAHSSNPISAKAPHGMGAEWNIKRPRAFGHPQMQILFVMSIMSNIPSHENWKKRTNKQASKQANKQTSKQANKQASKQAGRHNSKPLAPMFRDLLRPCSKEERILNAQFDRLASTHGALLLGIFSTRLERLHPAGMAKRRLHGRG